MKKFSVLFVVCLLASSVVCAANFAVVSMQQVVAQSQVGKDAQVALVAFRDAKASELRTLQEERDSAVKLFNTAAAKETAGDFAAYTELVSAKRLMESADTRLKNFQEDTNAALQNKQNTLSAEVQEKITTAVNALAIAEGFDLVLASDNPSVVYKADTVDITQKVLDKLNK